MKNAEMILFASLKENTLCYFSSTLTYLPDEINIPKHINFQRFLEWAGSTYPNIFVFEDTENHVSITWDKKISKNVIQEIIREYEDSDSYRVSWDGL